jgi:RNA polymerase sigma factor (sigma-70 family)
MKNPEIKPTEPADDPTDRELVARAQQQDLAAYNELIQRYHRKIYALVYNMTSNKEDAEDLVQEVFYKAYTALQRFKGDSSFYTWVYRIAVNRTINFVKRRKKRMGMSLDDVDGGVERDPAYVELVGQGIPLPGRHPFGIAGKIERGPADSVRKAQNRGGPSRHSRDSPRGDCRDAGCFVGHGSVETVLRKANLASRVVRVCAMNEDVAMDWKKYCLEHAGEPLPAEARALLLQDPELKRQVEQLVLVQKLISLKRHEQPDPAALPRCLQAVQARIGQREQVSLFARLREWFEFEAPAPAMAYGFAVAALLLVGAGVYVRGLTEPSAPVVAEVLPVETLELATELDPTPMVLAFQDEPELEENEPALAADMPSLDKPVIMLRVNALPPSGGRMSFGPDASTPVNFEY